METVKLDITKDDAPEMMEFYQKKKRDLREKHPDIFAKWDDYNKMIARLSILMSMPEKSKQESPLFDLSAVANMPKVELYPADGSWNQKIKYAIGSATRAHTAREIAQRIIEIEKITDKDEVKHYQSGISATLTMGYPKLYDRNKNQNGDYEYKIVKK